MYLIGQFDSPFTRRIGITLKHYELPFEHKPWSVFSDAEKLADVNPLIRVPTLILGSGEALIETSSIVDYLDSLVSQQQRLLPQTQPTRYQAMKIVSLASGISDKAVSLFYEIQLHKTPSNAYVSRLTKQIKGTMAVLERERIQGQSVHWFGASMTQADIAVTCMFRHLDEAFPHMELQRDYPALTKHCAHFEALDVFKEISQPFIPPA